jgi:thiopurine S-methyltransferase
MKASFWHQKWENNQIGFHESDVNPLLVKHIDQLNLAEGSRIFLPLCGKTLDMAWLLDKGYQVVGAELSELAIQQLFAEFDIEPQISEVGKLKCYQTEGLDIFVGDIFDLSAEQLGKVDAIYDRAALVALPPETRKHYTQHLINLTDSAPQLLLCFEYDQSLMSGPPFSIVGEEVHAHYDQSYDVQQLESTPMEGGFKGTIATLDTVWLLNPTA